jgi:hypothetical protein
MKCDVYSVALRWREVTTTNKARKEREVTEGSREEASKLAWRRH